MEEMVREMMQKGLIEIVRVPRSEELANLIAHTKPQPSGWVYWHIFGKGGRN